MRKTLLFLALSIFIISSVSAVSISSGWQNGAQSATISFRDSASFNADFYTISPPMTLNIKMYNSTGALVYVFEKNTVSTDYSFADTYIVNENAYKNPGNYTIVLSATDSFPSSKSTNLTLDVLQGGNNPPVITSTPVTSVDENTEYDYQVTATDKDGDTLTYSLINGPSWLSINSQTGLITGLAPNVSADRCYGISVQVSDGKADVSQNYTLTVKNVPVNHAPVITSTPIKTVNENTQYKYQVIATDADNNALTYSLSSNASSWLSINSQTGLITGTAPNVLSDKNYYVTITVNDGHGGTATQTYTLTVKNVNHVPVINTIPDQSVNEKTYYQYQIVASDPDSDLLIYTIAGPSWLSINSGTGLVEGVTPSVDKNTNYPVTITVNDGHGGTASKSYTLTVLNVNHPPAITSSPIKSVDENTEYKYQVIANDPDGDVLSYSLLKKPSWLSINSATGLVSGLAPNVTHDTNYSVMVSVSDPYNANTAQSYTLTVKNVIVPPVNHPPVAENENLTTKENTPITLTISATDPDNDALTYSIVNNPNHGKITGFDSSAGTLTYTPNSNFVGQDSFTFVANDGKANSNIATVNMNVTKKICPPANHAPVITSMPIKVVNESTLYKYPVVATDADNDALTYSLNTNASWLSINPSTGLVSGTAPSVNGDTNYFVGIEVSDGHGGIDTQSYTLTVKNITVPDTTPPVVTISSPSNNTYSTSSLSLIASTNEEATAWFSLNGGTNKTIGSSYGLNFNYALNGLSNGHYNLVVYAKDKAGNTGSASVAFSIDVHHNGGGGSSSVGEGANNQVPPIVVGADYGNISQTTTAPIETQGPTPQQSKTSPTWLWLLGILILFILILLVLILIRRAR